MKPIWISSGEPAGIGPDLCLALAGHPLPLVVLGDPELLSARAQQLKVTLEIVLYHHGMTINCQKNRLYVYAVPCPTSITPGLLNPHAASYVIELLRLGAHFCLTQLGAALVTAPVHKAIINQAGIPFTGHTEYFAELTQTKTVVMLLASQRMRVSLLTTHLALKDVPNAISHDTLSEHITILYASLQDDFGIEHPSIKVAGLNPHAGEGGYLGKEEQTIITPVIQSFQQQNMNIQGPYSADTLFINAPTCDAYIAMYHDQGLPVLKYSSFGEAVNVSCGLPFIRTSVDHGTALDLAGTGRADPASLLAAVALAEQMTHNRASR